MTTPTIGTVWAGAGVVLTVTGIELNGNASKAKGYDDNGTPLEIRLKDLQTFFQPVELPFVVRLMRVARMALMQPQALAYSLVS